MVEVYSILEDKNPQSERKLFFHYSVTQNCENILKCSFLKFFCQEEASAIYEAILTSSNPASATAFTSSIVGSCSCCMPVQIIPQLPIQVRFKKFN